ncbi:MAG: hypothetical protein R3F48_13355 [Candidatus Zixiibacteriota bacterium]
MNNTCTNKEIGQLLHAYEVGTLSDELVESFELHMMACDYCMARLKEFEHVTGMMKADDEIVREIASLDTAITETSRKKSFLRTFFKSELPFILRPAFLMAVLIIMAMTWAVTFLSHPVVEPGPVKELNLIQQRNGGTELVIDEQTAYVSVAFIYLDFNTNRPPAVLLERDGRDTVYFDSRFLHFDIYKVGRLLIPNNDRILGTYRLLICANESEMPEKCAEYIFSIK